MHCAFRSPSQTAPANEILPPTKPPSYASAKPALVKDFQSRLSNTDGVASVLGMAGGGFREWAVPRR